MALLPLDYSCFGSKASIPFRRIQSILIFARIDLPPGQNMFPEDRGADRGSCVCSWFVLLVLFKTEALCERQALTAY